MSTKNLVQVSDNAWIDPATVRAVKHWPPKPSAVHSGQMTRDNKVIIHDNEKCTISYWPFDRIRKVLGLTDRTWVYDFWENV